MSPLCAVLLALGLGVLGLSVAAPAAPEEATAAARSERSANLSHITGAGRKIRMFIKNRYLQLTPDGAVNGADDESDYSILQRQSVSTGQVKIQGVATCQYLCMNSCGILYASSVFAEDCVFNEMIEQHHYNTYSSTKYSNHRRTLYMALNKTGGPRRVQLKARSPLGGMSAYTRVLTTQVSAEEVEQLARRLLQQHPQQHQHHLRHHQLCPPAPPHAPLAHDTATATADAERCRKRKKRRKRRRCREDEEESDDCVKPKGDVKKRLSRKRCEEGEGKEKCQQKKLQMIGRKRKSRHESKRLLRHLHHPRTHQRSEEEEDEDAPPEHEHEQDDDEEATTTGDAILDTND